MQLTKFQIKRLKQYQKYRREAPTFLSILKAIGPLLLLLSLGAVFWFWAATYDGSPRLGWAFIGFIVGTVHGVITNAVAVVRMWPVIQELFHWDRVDELVRKHEDHAAS